MTRMTHWLAGAAVPFMQRSESIVVSALFVRLFFHSRTRCDFTEADVVTLSCRFVPFIPFIIIGAAGKRMLDRNRSKVRCIAAAHRTQ